MPNKKDLLKIHVGNILTNVPDDVADKAEIYFPALAGELPSPGDKMKEFAEAYVADMRAEWGHDHLLWVHVSLWSEMVTALTIAACKDLRK